MSNPELTPLLIVEEEEAPPVKESTPSGNGGEKEAPPEKCCPKFWWYVKRWLAYKDKEKWLEEMRGSLSLMASIIATMTFQLATNPPGGVLQVSADNVTLDCSNHLCPGQAVLGAVFYHTYINFLVCNTISFVASLSVCLLLVSGISLKHRFPVWLLSIGMCVTITSLALTYMFAASMVTPDPIWDSTASSMFDVVLRIWVGLLGIVGIFLIVRFVVWAANEWIKKGNRK